MFKIKKYNQYLLPLILLVVTGISIALSSCREKKSTVQSQHQAIEQDAAANSQHLTDNGAGADVYTCSMHPQIIRDKPGKCPICGMDLVKK